MQCTDEALPNYTIISTQRRLCTTLNLINFAISYSIYAPATQVTPLSQQNVFVTLWHTRPKVTFS